ncbi:MAG: hypothetical protein K0S44_3115 [Bacteroidetes bacterium]|jgi:uncharacterized protein (TIGR02453 family)|nr:hypothetical protein [Bacteroidota bacterium]
MKAQIPSSSFEFLKLVKKNNNRDWFNANKDRYMKEHEAIIAFADDLLAEMNKHDEIETASGKKSLHRIYKDTRFSKDKTPYKSNWSGSFSRATKKLRGGYYFHIEPGNSFAAGGFWGPDPADLKRIREEIAYDSAPLRKIIKSKEFKDTFGELQGEQLKSAPQGFTSDHKDIDLLRFKQFLLVKKFNDKEVLSENFLKELNSTFKKMRPFFDLMSEVLTTDANGTSTI